MPQDRESGKRAMLFGHSMAKRVAAHLGAKLVEPGRSNNAIWNSRKIVIKSASLGNTQIGVKVNALNWAEAVIVALQEKDYLFTLYEVSSSWYKSKMKPSRQPDLMMVSTSKIRNIDNKLARITGES